MLAVSSGSEGDVQGALRKTRRKTRHAKPGRDKSGQWLREMTQHGVTWVARAETLLRDYRLIEGLDLPQDLHK